MDQELTEQFNENMRQLTEMMAQLNSTMAGTVKSMSDASNAGTKSATSAKQNSDSQTNSTNQVVTGNVKLQEAQKKSGDIMAESAKNFAAAGFAAGNALKSFTQAVVSGEEGFKKYGASFSSIGDSALALGRNFGLLGTAAGLITKAFTAIAGPAFTQADNLLKASDSLSKLGAANAFSTDQIYSMGHKAGLTSQNLDKMIVPMQKMGTSFGAMGQNAEDATKQFSAMINVSEGVRNEFRRLGMNDQDRIQAQADFIETMNKSGMSIRMMEKSSGGLNKASLDYTRNLQVLADITGQSVEQQRKEQEVATANIQFQLYTNKMNREIRAAAASGDQKEVDRLNKQLQQARVAVEMANVTGGPEMAAAQAQYIMHGFSTIGVAQQAILGTMDDMQKAGRQVNEGLFDTREAGKYLDRTVEDVSSNLGQFSTSLSVSPDFASTLGVTTDSVQRLNEQFGKDHEAAAKNAQARIQANQAGKGAAAEDPLQQARDRLVEYERQASQALDDLYKSLQPDLMNAFTDLAKTVVPALIKSLEWLTGNIDKVKTAFGVLAGVAVTGAVISVFGKVYSAGKGLISIFGSMGSALKNAFGWIMSKIGLGNGGPAVPITEKVPASPAEARNASKAAAREAALAEARAAKAGTSVVANEAAAVGRLGKLGKALGAGGKALGRLAGPIAVLSSAAEGYVGWQEAAEKEKQGRISAKEASREKGAAVGGAAGSAAGGWAGAAVGASVGSVVPIVGTAIGGLLGGALGYWGGGKLGGLIGTEAGDKLSAREQKSPPPKPAPSATPPKPAPPVKQPNTNQSKTAALIKAHQDTISRGLQLTKTPEQQKTEQESVDKTLASARTISDASNKTEISSKKDEVTTKKFESIVASFGKIVTSDGKIVEAFGKIVVAFADAVTKFNDVITTFGDTSSLAGGSSSTTGSTTGGANQQDIQKAMGFLTNRGWSRAQAAGIVGNLVTESKLNTSAIGDNGKAYGIAQWHPDRQAKFKEIMGKDIRGSRLEDQLAFLDWELSHTEKNAGNALRQTTTAAQAASIFDRKYERSSGAAIQERMANANAILSGEGSSPGTGGTLASNIGKLFTLGGGQTGNARNLENLDPNFESRVLAAITEYYNTTQRKPTITSGFRFPGDQDKISSGSNPKAKSGMSRHERGLAMDMDSSSVSEMLRLGIFDKYGLRGGQASGAGGNLLSDPPHVELKARRGGVFNGSTGGYPVELHGSEMVAPLNLDSILMKLAKTSADTAEGQALTANITSSKTSNLDIDRIATINRDTLNMLSSKLDKMIDILDDGNNTRHKILQHSRA